MPLAFRTNHQYIVYKKPGTSRSHFHSLYNRRRINKNSIRRLFKSTMIQGQEVSYLLDSYPHPAFAKL